VDSTHIAAKFRPSPDVIARHVGPSAVLIHLESNSIFELNATGSRIWALLEQGLDRDALCAQLQQEFDAPSGELQQAVDELLSALTRERLICA
jgi:hypothetical protein